MWYLFFQVIAEYLQKIDPKSDGAKRDWVAIYDECANVLYQVARNLLHCNFQHLFNFCVKMKLKTIINMV